MTGDMACNMFFECLFEADGKGGWDGRLAESYEVADDNQALILHLRENAVWHDGEPFTADDVIFTIHLATNSAITTSRRLFLTSLDGVDDSGVELSEGSAHVEKIDDHTVKIYYRKPMSADGMLADCQYFAVLPEHILKDVDPATLFEN